MQFTWTAPNDEELEQGIRFQTYLNYIRAMANLMEPAPEGADRLLSQLISSPGFGTIQGNRCTNIHRVGELLRNAWFTELQLNLPSRSSDLIPYSIHWVAVQAYYAAYLHLRAYFLASGQTVGHEHASTLKAIAQEIKRKQNLFLVPWKIYCEDDPRREIVSLNGLAAGITLSKISPLQKYERVSEWDWYALFLKTTRQRQLEKVCDDWKRSNRRRRVPASTKTALLSNLSPTSIFNTLYRLRVRSNYEDADLFLLGALQSNNAQAKQFYNGLRQIVWNTSLLLETLVARTITKNKYKEILSDFFSYDRQRLSQNLCFKRWQIMATKW